MSAKISFNSNSVDDTVGSGRSLSRFLQAGDCILLDGELGSGKTQFAKGIGNGLGIAEEIISPTYNIVLEYPGDPRLYHFDLYRLDDEAQLEDIDFYYLTDESSEGVSLIEWSEKFSEEMPSEHLSVTISKGKDESSRTIDVEAVGDRYEGLLRDWARTVGASGLVGVGEALGVEGVVEISGAVDE